MSPRVLVITPDFPPAQGGIQLVMRGLAENLSATVRVVTLGSTVADAAETVANAEVRRVGVQRASRNKLAVLALNARALADGRRFAPDVVVAGHVVASPAAAVFARFGRIPRIQYLHADEARKRPRLTRSAVRGATAVVAVSSYAREIAVGLGARRVEVVHPGVELPTLQGEPKAERPTVLTVARMQEDYKGHDVILSALPAIRERVPEVEWVVVGEGALRPRIERMARERGLADAVRFTGAIDSAERDRWLQRAHVFAMPSRIPPGGTGGEGFGIVYLEAAASGLPVVAANVGGAVDAVRDGETGVQVDPTDVVAVGDAIAELLTDRDRATALGEAGLRMAREMTWRRHAERVGALIEDLNHHR